MRKYLNKILSLSIVKFGLVGASSTIIDLGLYKLFLTWGVNIYLATAIAFFTAFINGYIWNSRFVFSGQRGVSQSIKYLIVTVLGLIYTEGIIHLLHIELHLVGSMTAKLIAVAIVFFWNYLMSKLWAFK